MAGGGIYVFQSVRSSAKPKQMKAISVLVTGDFCPHYRIETLSAAGNAAAVFNDYLPLLKQCDLNITDIECPLTESKERIPKTGPYQWAAPHTVELLPKAGFHVAAMANNHIMDCGAQGALQTIAACKRLGIATVGIGTSDAEKRLPFSTVIREKKIAVLNFAESEFIITPDGAVKANPIDLPNNFRDIAAAKAAHDFVLVLLHGGNEFYHLPSPRMKDTCRFYVEAGADAVLCYHTHCFTGYEIFQDKPIFYGLGNFVYDWPGRSNGSWNHGYTVQLLLGYTIEFIIHPHTQGNEQPGVRLMTASERPVFFDRLNHLNNIIADDVQLAAAFNTYCSGVQRMYEAYIEPNFGKTIASLRARGWFPKFMKGRKKLLLLNIIRCEAHRDVLLKVLSNR
jgi:poly-gamma-glutamate capsule biosynthesis protein CapA/YwtB (metallophosphatase superfamily)